VRTAPRGFGRNCHEQQHQPALAIVLGPSSYRAARHVAFIWWRERRSKHCARFGPEYLRSLEESKSHERRLVCTGSRSGRIPFDPCAAAEEKARYAASWRKVQADFVDSPGEALNRADELLGSVMEARGYPVSDFAQRSADLSVDHAA